MSLNKSIERLNYLNDVLNFLNKLDNTHLDDIAKTLLQNAALDTVRDLQKDGIGYEENINNPIVVNSVNEKNNDDNNSYNAF